jgi:hypothetical protein
MLLRLFMNASVSAWSGGGLLPVMDNLGSGFDEFLSYILPMIPYYGPALYGTSNLEED